MLGDMLPPDVFDGIASLGGTLAEDEQPPRWERLTLKRVRDGAKVSLGVEVSAKTLRGAVEELQPRLSTFTLTCANCRVRVPEDAPDCWACGHAFGASGETEMADSELRERAALLGVGRADLTRDELVLAIEAEETRRRMRKDLVREESKFLNERITLMLPDGWSRGQRSAKGQARKPDRDEVGRVTPRDPQNYVSYVDPNGMRRIAVAHKGLSISFSVADDFFKVGEIEGLVFIEPAERVRRHLGRVSWSYVGDSSRVALELCRRVMEAHP